MVNKSLLVGSSNMSTVPQKTDEQLDEVWERSRVVVNLLVEKIYPVLLNGIETYHHFRWRLQQILEIHLGVLEEIDATGWLKQILDDIRESAATPENTFTRDETFKLVLTHLRGLNSDEVMLKIKAINGIE